MTQEDFFSNVLTELVNIYWSYSEAQIDAMVSIPGLEIKEKVARINDLNIIIYSNDHDPPHFHVISKDKSIDAKFTIANCELIAGEMNAKNMKRIFAFYNSAKTKMILEKIWNKKTNKP
ncbi:DUF4160 domain-containing protein [Chryseobacterium sp.]|uniref:DUF4160 domain-containing protein n=1 Tax=Chryseobacterium sp. TaxID=1871047 RepID=UPI0011C78264|nr:DUF4160 domain-containing protein [Chryseobacterium sp.]TXF79593.1 DUF4160 domain-containing protein [Chryseobacterium sp.]